MEEGKNLTTGSVWEKLILISIPLMATSFVQLSYSLTDIFWVGQLGVEQVAATGTVGYFTWTADAIIQIARIGVSVLTAQAVGARKLNRALDLVKQGSLMTLVGGICFGLFLFVGRYSLMGFFHLNETVTQYAVEYLSILCIAMPFLFTNPVLSTAHNSYGDSRTPFKINTCGLLLNMILDPVLILGLGPVPSLGIRGAALATSLSHVTVFLLFIFHMKKPTSPMKEFQFCFQPDFHLWKPIISIGLPSSIQNFVHVSISMLLNRFVALSGAVAVAVYSTGSQIESITWLTTEGFSFGLTAFIGQNVGAKKWKRVKEGIRIGLLTIGTIGIIGTLVLVLGRHYLFALFIHDSQEALRLGAYYLAILGASQFFMSIEIGSTGIFHGLGNTQIPSRVGVLFNALRIPLSLLLMPTYGAVGVWLAISFSSICKGIITSGLLLYRVKAGVSKNL